LLQSVLITMPGQITALNLLAVDAYKSADFSVAIDYWQQILRQFTPQMRGTEAESILKEKIAQTEAKIKLFESRRTK